MCALALAATAARADLSFQAVSGPVEARSWIQAFQVHADQAFQHLGLVLTPFDSTSGLKEPAWNFVDGNPSNFTGGPVQPMIFGSEFSVASGDATNDLLWESHFHGDETKQQFLLTLFAFDDTFHVDIATAAWTGRSWDFGPHTPGVTWDEFVAAGGISGVAPIPSAAAMGLLGLLLFGAVRRRVR